jgi:DNA polymerase-3 subunit beta
VLAGLRIHADQEVSLSAFDYEVSARATIATAADEPGTILVSGKLLAEIVRNLPTRPVEITTDGTRATLRCGTAAFHLMLLPTDEYPTLPEMPPTAGLLGADTFSSAIAQVAAAAGRDDTLPALTGVRAEINGDLLTLAATDRYRLAVRELHWNPVVPGLDTAVLIPAKVLDGAARAMTGGAEVTIGLSADRDDPAGGIVGFEGAGHRTTTRLLSGEFPNYRTLLPTEFSAAAELAAVPFAAAVKRVALVAERNTPVRLTFAPGGVRLEAGTGDEAQATEEIETSFDGDEINVAFNPQYLLDGINAVDSDIVRISFTSPLKPAVLTGKDDELAGFRYVLMPIRAAG